MSCEGKCTRFKLVSVYGAKDCQLGLKPETCGKLDPVPIHNCEQHKYFCEGDLIDFYMCTICGKCW